jgi:hypothetical protein
MANGRKKGEPGAKFYTYVEEKALERKLNRSFDLGKGSTSTAWGDCLEQYLFEVRLKDDLSLSLQSKTTLSHPEFYFWAGSPDIIVEGEKVTEVKCYEPKKFCKYADVLMQQDVELLKSTHPDEYWQIVSNACILGVERGEAMLYMPYQRDLNTLREWIEMELESNDLFRFRFITEYDDYKLPYVPNEGSKYKDLVRFEFEVPKADKEALTERVKLAEKELQNQLK